MHAPVAATPYRHFHRIAWLAVALAFGVIVFGAFVRLSNAGLSCPDWPTCYGRAAWPGATHDSLSRAAEAIRPVEPHKAWREQLHRMLAGTLGLLVLVLALLATRKRPQGWWHVLGAAASVGIAIPLYMRDSHVAAAFFAVSGEMLLLAGAWRWPDAASRGSDFARVSTLTFAVIVFQALLGMWTVTWLLKPIVVMGHLLGGLLTFALLAWTAWRATGAPIRLAEAMQLRRWVIAGLLLLAAQIALGGWTSANYAALACGNDFPTCVARWWPPHDFHQGFVLWRGIGVDYEGGVLDGAARIAIHLAHRIGAAAVFAFVVVFALKLWRTPGMRDWSAILLALVFAQAALGIANVRLGLPLHVAVLHNAGAALLLFALVTLLARLRLPEA